ncbi:max-like protein X isoform X2 [Paramacrobiotus metropolitanus]|uniref:max-like protein X isoform X2 n=1 Tax=Paramacrobiotus metropolitanus TaxID=2943436 RepID=UPI0024460423|nr:max-like protein X isoform X2 [Paramacrobiotus metropolitanus]
MKIRKHVVMISQANWQHAKRRKGNNADVMRPRGIKLALGDLKNEVVPNDGATELRGSKILEEAMNTIKALEEVTQEQKGELQRLRQTLAEMEIIKAQDAAAEMLDILPSTSAQPNSDDAKFHVFQRLMDQLFQTYDHHVDASSFQTLSDTTYMWLEELCSPSSLMALTAGVLRDRH